MIGAIAPLATDRQTHQKLTASGSYILLKTESVTAVQTSILGEVVGEASTTRSDGVRSLEARPKN